jgi:hypothetical protein
MAQVVSHWPVSLQRPEFGPGSVHVGFVVDRVELGWVFQFSFVTHSTVALHIFNNISWYLF